MRNLLIIGCGDVLRRVIPLLHARAPRWRILALVRRHDPQLAALGVRQILGDLDQPSTLRRLAGLADAVLHGAPPDAQGASDHRMRNLLAALARGQRLPRRIVYISTTGVYGDSNGAQVSETRPLAPVSARALRRVDAERRLRQLTRAKRRNVEYENGGACTVSILRAPGIYAANRMPLERLQRGLPLMRAEEDSITNHIHAEDLARACLAALHRGRANRCYNICDDSGLAMGEWFDKLADAFGLPRAPRLPRAEVKKQVSPLQWSFMNESRRLDNHRMKQELKLRLRYPTVDAGIAAARASGRPSEPAGGDACSG